MNKEVVLSIDSQVRKNPGFLNLDSNIFNYD